MTHARFTVLALVLVSGCAAPQEPAAVSPTTAPSSQETGLRSADQVEQAIVRARAAYLEGRWGDVVVDATRVIEGAASPEQYYDAVKLLGLASCSRQDPGPVTFAFKRLQGADQASLRGVCGQHGIQISDDGQVTRGP